MLTLEFLNRRPARECPPQIWPFPGSEPPPHRWCSASANRRSYSANVIGSKPWCVSGLPMGSTFITTSSEGPQNTCGRAGTSSQRCRGRGRASLPPKHNRIRLSTFRDDEHREFLLFPLPGCENSVFKTPTLIIIAFVSNVPAWRIYRPVRGAERRGVTERYTAGSTTAASSLQPAQGSTSHHHPGA